MRIVDFAGMLQGSINGKIKMCKGEVRKETEALDLVQGQIQHLVINNERRTRKYGFDQLRWMASRCFY
jgi:hypothetical protein